MDLRVCGLSEKLRGGLQNHVVLVERGVNGRDLRLAKTEVQRIINELRRDAVTRGGLPIVGKQHLQAAVLLVGGHVLELRYLEHFVVQARTPDAEVFHRVGGELVLVGGIALAAAHAKILRRLQEGRSAGELFQFRPQAIDHGGGADAALVERLEVDKGEAGVAGAPARSALASGKADDVVHGWIGLNHLFNIQNGVAHGLKGGVLRALEPTLDATRVLQGEKSLGYAANQDDVQG